MSGSGVDVEEVLRLARLGFRLHPLVAGNKVPIVAAWPQHATSDEERIRAWARVNEGCNWGLATGQSSGVFVVDIDPRHGGDDSWNRLVMDNQVPRTATCITGGGGTHLYFTVPKTVVVRNSSNKIGKGIDVRGDGGQVVVPPSVHPSGTRYSWVPGLAPWEVTIPPAPRWLMRLIKEDHAVEQGPAIGEELEVGTRNSHIYHQALMLARQGALREVTYAAMRTWCDNTGNPDISDDEIRKTVDSSYKKAEDEAQKRSQYSDVLRNDADNADRLLREYKVSVVYVFGLGWHVWNGRYWEPDLLDKGIRQRAIDTMRKLRDEALDEAKDPNHFKVAIAKAQWATQSLNNGRLESMIKIARGPVLIKEHQVDPPSTRFLMNFKNGTVDLKTGELHPHDKQSMITKMVEHDYKPEAECPTWERTLELAFDGNKDLISFVQRALGYTISGSVAEQCMFVCWGAQGNNGKSTILETVQRVLGAGYAQMSDMAVITSKEKGSHALSGLAKLVGVRMVNMNEAEEHQRLSESLIKQITGGDTIQAKMLYKEPFEYVPIFKLWIRTNEKPEIRGTSNAIWRRVCLIPFDKSIPAEVRESRDTVDQRLEAESEGIIAWLVRGFQAWQRDGLNPPDKVLTATKEYREENDLYSTFMDECATRGDPTTTYTRIARLTGAFNMWLVDNGYKFKASSKYVSKQCQRVGLSVERGIANVSIARGVELTAEWDTRIM